MFYRIVRGLLKFFMFFMFRIRVEGKENVPRDGSAMLVVNHKSNWDPILVAIASPRKLRFMAKSELFKNKLFSFVLTALGVFPVHRGKGDIGAIKSALSILKNNEFMLIFPEGGRVLDERTSEAKPGAVMLAVKSKSPIVPAYISGRYRWFSKLTIRFGTPVTYEKYYDEKLVVDQLQALSKDLLKTMRSYKLETKEKNK